METYRFVQEIGYSELHVFPFSRRTGTPAARMENQVPKEVKEIRVQKMISLSNHLAEEYASQYENAVLEVIPEEKSSQHGHLVGFTDNYLKVQFEGPAELIGSIVRVKLTKTSYSLNKGIFVKVADQLKTS